MKRVCLGAALIAVILIGSGRASAQNPSIAFTLLQNISFGTVLTNTSSTISVSGPGAGEFESAFSTNSKKDGTASFNFSLPRRLRSGMNSMWITFGGYSAAYNSTNSLSGSTSFDPSQGLSGIPVTPNTPSTIYFWIGGTVSPGAEQASGTYTGTIMVSGTIVLANGKTVTETQPVIISVTAVQALSLASAGSLDFGEIVAGTSPASLSPQSNPRAPMFTAVGSPGKTISVSYDAAVTLSDANGHTLTFRPVVSGSTVRINQAGSTRIPSGIDVELSDGIMGHYYFWLGGSLNSVPRGQLSGNYSGTFTLSATY